MKMYNDEEGLNDSVIFRLSKNVEHFRDFSEDMIIDPLIDLSVIKKIIEKQYSTLEWSDEGNGVYFGFIPSGMKVEHRFDVEVWLNTKLCCIHIEGGYAIDIKAIARNLDMVAFDVLNGDRIYP